MELKFSPSTARKPARRRCRRNLRARAARDDLIQRCVNWQLAKRQRGTHKTKAARRDQPHRQEDVRAEGHRRRPSRRAERPAVPRRRPCLRSGRAQPRHRPAEEGARAGAAARAVVEGEGRRHRRGRQGAPPRTPRPRRCAEQFGKLGFDNALIIDGAEIEANFRTAARNIPNIDVLPVQGINVYDIMRRKTLVLTKAALDALEARFK